MKSFPSLMVTAGFLLVAMSGCAVGGDKPASADFKATPLDADKTSYKFDATGGGASYIWDFGDRSDPMSGKSVQHTYQYPNGKYSVTLSVKDKAGLVKTQTQKIQVGSGENKVPVLFLKAEKRLIKTGDKIMFDASQSYDPDGDPLIFQWDFNDHRNQDAFKGLDNMGRQEYAHYSHGPPKSSGTPGSNSSAPSGGLIGKTPSGYDWEDEYAKALARVDKITSPYVRHVPGPEPRNTDLDGTTNETGPIQIFPFPSAATYFVVVKAVDIKGDYAEGYIRISVLDAPLPGYTGKDSFDAQNDTPATLYSKTLATPLDQAQNPQGASTWARYMWTEEFPGNGTVEISVTGGSAQTPGAVRAAVCSVNYTNWSNCIDNGLGAHHGILMSSQSSKPTLYFNFTPEQINYPFTTNYQFFVANDSDSTLMVTWKMHVKFDENPWAQEEFEGRWGG